MKEDRTTNILFFIFICVIFLVLLMYLSISLIMLGHINVGKLIATGIIGSSIVCYLVVIVTLIFELKDAFREVNI